MCYQGLTRHIDETIAFGPDSLIPINHAQHGSSARVVLLEGVLYLLIHLVQVRLQLAQHGVSVQAGQGETRAKNGAGCLLYSMLRARRV